jgi:hypothetical protein
MKKRINLSSKLKLEQSRRRSRLAELAASGKDLRQCETLLKAEGFAHVHFTTLGRDLRQARAELNQSTQATLQQDRDQMRKNLLALVIKVNERDFRTGWDDPSCTRDFNCNPQPLVTSNDAGLSVPDWPTFVRSCSGSHSLLLREYTPRGRTDNVTNAPSPYAEQAIAGHLCADLKIAGLECRYPGCGCSRQRRHTIRETGGLAALAA